MTTSAEFAVLESKTSGVRAEAKRRWRVRICVALVAIAVPSLLRTAQGAPRRPVSLLDGGQIAAYGQRGRTCQDRLMMSVPGNPSSGDYAMCCREFKPIPLFPDEMVEAEVRLDRDEDLL